MRNQLNSIRYLNINFFQESDEFNDDSQHEEESKDTTQLMKLSDKKDCTSKLLQKPSIDGILNAQNQHRLLQ